MRELLAARPRARGGSFTRRVVAANDLIALGALQVLQAKGIEVPQQVSLIGHNDMPLLDQLRPPLSAACASSTTRWVGARARLLLAALNGVPETASTIVLRPELMVRGSTAAAPGRA